MKRGTDKKKGEDASFKDLLARLDGGLDLQPEPPRPARAGRPPGEQSALTAGLPASGFEPRPSMRRGVVWAGISAGSTTLVVLGLLVYPLLSRRMPVAAADNERSKKTQTAMAASVLPDDRSRSQLETIAPAAVPSAIQPRIVRTQAVSIAAAEAGQVVTPATLVTTIPPASKAAVSVAKAQAQLPPQPGPQPQPPTETPTASTAPEPDGPPVPLVARPSRSDTGGRSSPSLPPDTQSRDADRPQPPALPSTGPVVRDAKLLVAPHQRTRAGESAPFAIKVDVPGLAAERLRVAVTGLGGGVTFSSGMAVAPGRWDLPVRGIEQVRLFVPVSAGDDMSLALELLDAEGNSLARAVTLISILPAPPKPAAPIAAAPPSAPAQASAPAATPAAPAAPPRLTMDEHTALIERGRLLARNGDIASARLLFERAADAGSGRAALLLGETYDPEVLAGMGVLGAKGDLTKARKWYAKANELGLPLAAERLRALAGK